MKRLLISLVTSGSLLVPALSIHAAPAPSRVIGFADKCLDADSNQGGGSGSTIQIYDCLNPGLNQKWIFDGSLIKSAAYPGKCLDADSNQDGADGSKVQLYSCNNAANQRWKFDGRFIKSVAYPGKCLDADSNQDGANGSKVRLYSCNNGANQRWKSQ